LIHSFIDPEIFDLLVGFFFDPEKFGLIQFIFSSIL